MSLVGYLMNFSQYMQALQSVPAFRGIAKDFEGRAARFAVQKQAAEKDALDFVKKAAGRVRDSGLDLRAAQGRGYRPDHYGTGTGLAGEGQRGVPRGRPGSDPPQSP